MSFDIASIGKNFLAILVCQLIEEGRLSLDDSLSEWLPDHPYIDNKITIRQLLNHTSGIFDWVEHPQSPYRKPFDTIFFEEVSSPEEVVKTLVSEPYFPPGGGFRYSTTNYTLLRMIVEKVGGSTVARQIQKRFLEPLNLKHTFVLDAETPIPHTMSIAHAWWDVNGDGTLDDITSKPTIWIATRSPALIYSTARDLARWSQSVYSGELLDQASLRQVLTFHRPTPSAPGEPFSTGYGLGTQELRLGGQVMWGHLGWQYGYTSSMLYIPKHTASIAVLINDNNMMLINLAAIALWIAMEFHLETIRFLLLSGSVVFLLSMYILWPIRYVFWFLRHRGIGSVALEDVKKRKASASHWVASLAGIVIAVTAIIYLRYSMNPATPLSWVGGNLVTRLFIILSMISFVVSLSLIFFTFRAWEDKLWSIAWRIHYTLVSLSALVAAGSLFASSSHNGSTAEGRWRPSGWANT